MWIDLYSKPYHYYSKATVGIVVKNLLIAVVVTLALVTFLTIFVLKVQFRELLIFLLVGTLSLFLLHFAQFLWIKHLSLLGFFKSNVLLVGNHDSRLPVDQMFQDMGNSKINCGRISKRKKGGPWIYYDTSENEKVIKSVSNWLLKLTIGEVIIFIDDTIDTAELRDIATFCRNNSIGYYLVPDLKILERKKPWDRMFTYIPLIEHFSPNRESLTSISLKRVFDMLLVTFAAPIIFPLMGFIAFLIKIEDGGPAFYISTRIGKDGKEIRFFKFRSMVVNAEKMKEKLLKFNERKDGPLFKMTNDPRITRIGRILRKYSLDEIPQFINVIKGDMSIVGPRPHLPNEVKAYGDRDYLRLQCIPGIVCIPQVIERNKLTFREWVDLDLQYRKNWTLSKDFIILFKIIKVLLNPLIARQTHSN